MRNILLLIFSCITFSLCAQVGRYEEPIDTIPIGGQTQENKVTQMQAQDQLTQDLLEVRDSLQFITGDALATRTALDQIVKGLKEKDHSPELMKRGYALLNEIRTDLRNGTKARDARKSFRK